MDNFSFTHAFQQIAPHETIPEGFDAVVIPLDGRKESKLDWTIANITLPTIYDFELGLFHELTKPIQHVAQFQALSFAVDRFVSLVDYSAGCILYKGPFLEDEAQIDFLHLLVNSLPPHITPYALQDASPIQDPLHFATLLLKQQAAGLHPVIQDPPFPTDCAIWKSGSSRGPFIGRRLPEKKALPEPFIGIVVHDTLAEFEGTIKELIAQDIAFRIISEDRLTIEWDGIDTLILPSKLLGTTQRKLQGFQAAGGSVIDRIWPQTKK